MFNRRSDYFEGRKEQDIQPILKKEENGSFIKAEYELNVVLQFKQNMGWFVILQD